MSNGIPILFKPKLIRNVVEKDRPGVYVLGNDENGFKPKYVGRSDYCIRNRLLTHNHLYDYDYFMFKYVDNQRDAFYLEAKWWHDCINNGVELDNMIHPDAPSGTFWTCPYCDFAKSVKDIVVDHKNVS